MSRNIGAASRENLSSRFPTRSDTNQAAQPHEMAKCIKFQNKEVKGLHYLCNRNKGTDQLHGNHATDRHFVFLNAKAGFLMMWLISCTLNIGTTILPIESEFKFAHSPFSQ